RRHGASGADGDRGHRRPLAVDAADALRGTGRLRDLRGPQGPPGNRPKVRSGGRPGAPGRAFSGVVDPGRIVAGLSVVGVPDRAVRAPRLIPETPGPPSSSDV